MIFQENIIDVILGWIGDNLFNIILVALVIVIGWIFYLIFKKQISRLQKQGKFEEQTARNLQRIVKIIIVLIIVSTILIQFVEAIGLITSLFTLVGGTIFGFAAITTIGNAIAGLIIMVSRPFVPGDYIIYKNRIAMVQEIKLIFTILTDFDGVKISIPNQKLISEETENLGKKDMIRRSIRITADYGEDRQSVKKALLEAADLVPQILKEPKPYVWISNFQEFAVEYTLYVYIREIKSLPSIEAKLRSSIFNTVNKYKIDISTPSLIKRLNTKD